MSKSSIGELRVQRALEGASSRGSSTSPVSAAGGKLDALPSSPVEGGAPSDQSLRDLHHTRSTAVETLKGQQPATAASPRGWTNWAKSVSTVVSTGAAELVKKVTHEFHDPESDLRKKYLQNAVDQTKALAATITTKVVEAEKSLESLVVPERVPRNLLSSTQSTGGFDGRGGSEEGGAGEEESLPEAPTETMGERLSRVAEEKEEEAARAARAAADAVEEEAAEMKLKAKEKKRQARELSKKAAQLEKKQQAKLLERATGLDIGSKGGVERDVEVRVVEEEEEEEGEGEGEGVGVGGEESGGEFVEGRDGGSTAHEEEVPGQQTSATTSGSMSSLGRGSSHDPIGHPPPPLPLLRLNTGVGGQQQQQQQQQPQPPPSLALGGGGGGSGGSGGGGGGGGGEEDKDAPGGPPPMLRLNLSPGHGHNASNTTNSSFPALSITPGAGSTFSPSSSSSSPSTAFISRSELEYNPSEKIGSGAFGFVCKGKYRGRAVAIKVLHGGGYMTRDERSDFLKEARHTFTFRHENVVLCFGVCVEDGVGESEGEEFMAIVLDLAKGTLESASKAVGGDRYTTQALLYILEGAAEGLAYLHASKLVHRDIKPSNILLMGQNRHERGLVGDLGLAKVRTSVSRRGTAFAGTLVYADPAVLEGAPQDQKADVYAFGVSMWEALSGKVAFSELDDAAPLVFMDKLRAGHRPSLNDLREDVPQEVRDVIALCWAGREARPTMLHVAQVLRAAQ